MEEVYVIRLRGVPSASTSEATASTSRQFLRTSILGLGGLHMLFGLLSLVFGLIRPQHEPRETLFGLLFGPLFAITGLVGLLSCRRHTRKVLIKTFFGLSLMSLVSSSTFLGVCVLGTVTYHSTPRVIGETAHVTANAILTAIAEGAISLASILISGALLWKRFHFLHNLHQKHHSRLIVKTDIVGNSGDTGTRCNDDLVRHVSPNCVVSLRASDEQRRAMDKVREYLDEQMSCSFSSDASEDCSASAEGSCSGDLERDLGVDSESWRNEVLSVRSSVVDLKKYGRPVDGRTCSDDMRVNSENWTSEVKVISVGSSDVDLKHNGGLVEGRTITDDIISDTEIWRSEFLSVGSSHMDSRCGGIHDGSPKSKRGVPYDMTVDLENCRDDALFVHSSQMELNEYVQQSESTASSDYLDNSSNTERNMDTSHMRAQNRDLKNIAEVAILADDAIGSSDRKANESLDYTSSECDESTKIDAMPCQQGWSQLEHSAHRRKRNFRNEDLLMKMRHVMLGDSKRKTLEDRGVSENTDAKLKSQDSLEEIQCLSDRSNQQNSESVDDNDQTSCTNHNFAHRGAAMMNGNIVDDSDQQNCRDCSLVYKPCQNHRFYTSMQDSDHNIENIQTKVPNCNVVETQNHHNMKSVVVVDNLMEESKKSGVLYFNRRALLSSNLAAEINEDAIKDSIIMKNHDIQL